MNLDNNGEAIVATRGWLESSKESFADLINYYAELGVNRLLCTDIGKDGTLQGPNCDLYKKIIDQYDDIEVLASGGVHALSDVTQLKKLGAYGVIVGKALYENRFTVEELLRC